MAEALLSPAGFDADAQHAGLTPDGAAPERRCVATGVSAPLDSLIRFVVDPAGALVPDLDHKLPGRGLYVAADRAAVELALKKTSVSRAARQPVAVPEDLAARLELHLVQRSKQLIGLARRAGQAVAGYDRVAEYLKAGRAALLLQAGDSSPAGRAKLSGKVPNLPEFALLTAAELAEPFGRDHIVHVALGPGGLARRLQTELARLKGLRAAPTPKEVP